MKPELQQIAIAEACGWTCIEKRAHVIIGPNWLSGMNPKPQQIEEIVDLESGTSRKPTEMDYGWESLPDYLGDLNAMHEAEKTLTPGQRKEYHVHLLAVWLREFPQGQIIVDPECFDATARQRAEAFVRTIGKWEE